MYHRKITQTGIAAVIAAASFVQSVRADNTKPTASDKAVDLGKVEVQGNTTADSILPVGPTSSLYGYEQSLKETPRSIYQVSKTQLDEDVIQNFSDLSRYSPSVQKSTTSPYSTFAIIRGGSSDTMRNGILLLNPAVRPFDNNSWESADIVAGVPSVAFGSTTRTAGYVNYITKQPFYDTEHGEINASFGRLGANSETTYGQFSTQIDVGAPLVKDKLAYRVSIQESKADNYWANSAANFFDLYGALSWKPTRDLTIETNVTYTKSDGPYPYGINRITQNLVDNWTYISGPASPILSNSGQYFRANSAGTYDAGTISNGLFVANGTKTAATWTQSNPANLVGWVLNPENAVERKIDGNQTIFDKNSFSRAHEYIGQVISTLALNETFTLRNNTLFQYSDSYVHGYDEYESYMVNKFITSRVELISNSNFQLFGQDITHKSNSGFDWRLLWNLCDNAGKPSERPISAADAFDPGTLGSGYLLGTNLYPNALSSASSLYNAELTKYGWINIAPGYKNSSGRVDGLSIASLGGSDLRVNQLSTYGLYSDHNFDIGDKWSWRIGGRLTRIQDYLRATPQTYTVASQGYLPGIGLSDNATAWNYDLNTSLNYRPTKRITTYFTYDYDLASADCGCCLTQGFVGPNQTLEDTYYKVLSRLYEVGAKYEVIPNKLFTSVAVFRQNREVPSIPTASNPTPVQVALLYKGTEFSVTYQPTKHFSLGANYAYLWATYVNQTAGGVYGGDYNGFVADGSTIVNNATSSVGTNAGVRGNYRALATPLNSAGGWASYEFDNGFGLKASTWVTSSWLVSRLVTVPTQYNVDLGAFYTFKRWRADLSFRNVTNEKNWSPGGNYAGGTTAYLLPYERFGVTGKIAYRF